MQRDCLYSATHFDIGLLANGRKENAPKLLGFCHAFNAIFVYAKKNRKFVIGFGYMLKYALSNQANREFELPF